MDLPGLQWARRRWRWAAAGLALLAAAGYPVPQVITLHLTGAGPEGVGLCGGSWPVRAIRPRLQIASGCPARDLGLLFSRPIGYSAINSQFSAVAVVRPPGAGRCWAVAEVVLRYHVGIRHWTATYTDVLAACASTSQALLDQTINRVARAGPQ